MRKEEREAKLKERLQEMKQYENYIWAQGIPYIAGIDEVGRGPLAGPVVAAAVVLPSDFEVLGVDDSKKLSEKKREELFEPIKQTALAVGIGMRDSECIDEINILEATKEAMTDALLSAQKMLKLRCGDSVQIGHVLFDAMKIEAVKLPQTSLIKGDTKSVSIAAASIIAKVTRDRIMREYAKKYPQYAFESNKGYGTKAHYEGLAQVGICPIHRRTFLKNLTDI
jgi:ribonuclease HII